MTTNDDEIFPTSIFLERKLATCSTFGVSIIIPTRNASQHIATTIDSILAQKDCRFEVIFVDGESTDTTVEIIRSYQDSRIRVQTVPTDKLFEMVNRGIAMAQGDYINILLPADNYLYADALVFAMWQIAKNDFPDLFYSASILRDEWHDTHFLFRPLNEELLRQGMQPTNLQSCWIKKEVFKRIGYFDTQLLIRGALDFFIRFERLKEKHVYSEIRVYVDTPPRPQTYAYLMRNFKETFQIIKHHFGSTWAFLWLFKQKDLKRIAIRTMENWKQAIFGKA